MFDIPDGYTDVVAGTYIIDLGRRAWMKFQEWMNERDQKHEAKKAQEKEEQHEEKQNDKLADLITKVAVIEETQRGVKDLVDHHKDRIDQIAKKVINL